MNSKIMIFSFLAVLALFLAGALAATITVGPEGCDHVSIQAAIEAASPGDVVEVGGGTYRENLVVDMPIVLRGAGDGTEKPIVDAGGRGSAVTLVADGVRLEGFVLENGGFGWAGIDVRSGENLIRGNLVTENRWYGIFLDGSSDSIVEENVVWKNKYGIWINAGSDENRIRKNLLQENENYNAFDLGTNLWEGNFYGDFDGSLSVYEVPGISSVDRSPSGPERGAAEEPENEPEKVPPPAVEDAAGAQEAAPSEDSSSGEESSASPAPEATPAEEPTKRTGTSLMDLDLKVDSSGEEAAEVLAAPAVSDAVVDAELGESETVEAAGEPIVEEPSSEVLSAGDWVRRGDSLSGAGRYDEAVICYERALEMEPELAAAWDGKGDALLMTGSYDKALRCYERALVIDPRSLESWYHKGEALQMLLRFDEALGCYDEVLKINPSFAEAWNKKGMALNRLGRYQEALDCFDEALKIAPGYAAAWSNKSWSLQMQGEGDAAKEAFDRARALGYG
ncbi:tetratricopeptide repeat protein [Methanocrinis sp.]|uniref:tetratricopeptide repeat protein n=1 Tax=Methanocrinis sp. TaxID=3101522 RepID=UPI003D0F9E97